MRYKNNPSDVLLRICYAFFKVIYRHHSSTNLYFSAQHHVSKHKSKYNCQNRRQKSRSKFFCAIAFLAHAVTEFPDSLGVFVPGLDYQQEIRSENLIITSKLECLNCCLNVMCSQVSKLFAQMQAIHQCLNKRYDSCRQRPHSQTQYPLLGHCIKTIHKL